MERSNAESGRQDFGPGGPQHRRRTHVFRVTYCTVFTEWGTALIAIGLLSYYLYAISSTREEERSNTDYKVKPRLALCLCNSLSLFATSTLTSQSQIFRSH